MASPSILRSLGLQPYSEVFTAMKRFTASRDANTADEFWLVSHPPVFTLGLAADPTHLLNPRTNIPIEQIDRGGEVTYHGPGQAIVYTLLDLRRGQMFIRAWVAALEATTIDFLARYDIQAKRRSGAPGVYIALQNAPYPEAKIAALGLKVTRGSCYHGIALNIAMDLSPFLHINPCGILNLSVLDMNTLVPLTHPATTIAHEYAMAIQQTWDQRPIESTQSAVTS